MLFPPYDWCISILLFVTNQLKFKTLGIWIEKNWIQAPTSTLLQLSKLWHSVSLSLYIYNLIRSIKWEYKCLLPNLKCVCKVKVKWMWKCINKQKSIAQMSTTAVRIPCVCMQANTHWKNVLHCFWLYSNCFSL